MGRLLMTLGGLLFAAGAIITLAKRFGLSRLPGDLVFRRGHVTVFIPLATSLLLSIVLTVVLSLIFRR